MNQLPPHYTDICPTLRKEVEEALGVYFNEELLEMFSRGVFESDVVTLEEAEEEAREFIECFLMERLQDQF